MAGEETEAVRNPTGTGLTLEACLVDLSGGRKVAEVELTRDTEERDEIRW